SYTITNSSAFPLSGQLLNLPLPADLDNQPVAYLRWLMTENVSINNSMVTNDGTNRIDDIFIKGNYFATSINGSNDASGVVFPLGTSVVTYTITETVSDQYSVCDFTVTVEDEQTPEITCPSSVFQSADVGLCSANISLELPIVSDNCTLSPTISYNVFNPDNSSSGPFPSSLNEYDFLVGNSLVEWIVTDASSNTINCFQQVIINEILPYADAGSDAAMCSSQGSHVIAGAFASNYVSLYWSTSGTGSFSAGQGTLTPSYTLSDGDILSGQIVLTLTASGGCSVASDFMVLTIWKEASVYAGPDAAIAAGQNYTLSGATAGNYSSLHWTSTGTGFFNNPAAVNPTYIPSEADIVTGSIDLMIEATGFGVCATISDVMTLTIHPNPIVNAGSDAEICTTDGSYFIENAQAFNYTTVQWTTSGTGTFINAGAIKPTYVPSLSDKNTGQVLLTMAATGNGGSDSDFMVLSIFPPPTANAGSNAVVCQGDSFTVVESSATQYSDLSWSHNGSGELTNYTTLSPTYIPAPTETGPVLLTLTANGHGTCAAAVDEFVLTIAPSPVSNAGDGQDLCNQVLFVLSGNVVPNSTVKWTLEAGPNTPAIFDSDKPNALVVGAIPGVYTFVYTVTLGSCKDSDKVRIANWENVICCVNAGPDISVCDVTSVAMNAGSPIVGIGTWSQMSGPNTAVIDDPVNSQSTMYGLIPGTYIFRWTNTNGPACSVIYDDMMLTVANPAMAYAGQDMTICQNQSYQLDHATASNYISLLWSTSGTGFFSNRYALNPVYTPSASDKLNGIVQLTLTAYSSAPCSPAIRSMLLTLQAPASLEAVNDILGPVNGYEGSLNAGVATENDLRNGLPVEASQIIASLVTPATPLMPGSPVPAFDPVTGIVSVIPQTPSGIYSISYRICENICPENCSQATIFIQVISAEIVANNDNFTMSPVNGYIGGFVSGSILANDVLNSVAVNVDEINVELTDDGGMTGVVLNESNQVVIPASTPAGVYTLTYKICEILNPANCDDALIFVLVNPPPIVANDDDFIANQINGFTGGVAGSLLPNDLLNGIIALQSEVMIGIVSDGGLTGIATDIDGNLVVPGFVASGTYTVTYKLCEILNPDNCDMADAIVRVISPDIIANDDDFIASPVNGNHGGTSGNVLANDYLNGNLVHQDDILISIVNDGGLTGLFIGTDGWVDVPAGTSAGIYTATYSICDLINPTNCDEATITVKVYTPLIALRKLATTSNYGSAGEMITYTISVENSGAVEISDLAVEDVLATNGPVYVSGDEGASGILDVGEIWIYSATYTIKQSDVDAGTFTNTAIVTGNDPNGNPLSAEDTETVVAIINPEVAITKACTTIPNFYIAVDDELTYTISIENTGNVTLYDVLVTDHQTGLNQTFSILSPGELINLNTSYYVSQADIDAGKFDNTATVSATFTAGNAAPQFLLDNDSETVFAEQQPGIFVTKASTKVPNSYSQPEEELTYNISVTNTGNVTLNNVLVIDPLTGLSQSIASLAPQSSQSFNTSYTVGQADLDAGQVDNMANATGFYYDVNGLQLSVTCNDTETVYSNQISAIGLIKTASYDQNTGLIIYTYSVTNTGNVTLYDIEVYEQESSFTGSGILPVPLFFAGGSYLGGNGVLRDIAPGQRIIFRASYSVEQADIDEGFVSNQAQTSGFTSNGAVIADLSDFTSNLMDRPTVVIFEHYPEITLTKVADPMIYNEINQEISYTITVKNEGNVTLSNIIAEDPMLGLVTNIFTLAPNAEVTFMNSYFITMDDLIEGNIVNTATVEGNDPRSNAVYAVDEVTIVALFSEIIANDDDFGTIGDPGKSTEAGNVLDNDYFKGVKVERDMVSLEVVSAASDPGVYIDITTGNLNVQTGVPSGSYAIEYRICEIGNPANCDNAIATIEVLRQCIEISSWVYLEGAAVDPCGLLDYTFPMRTDLNDLRLLPGQTFEDVFFGTHYTPAGQPYNVAPWFYNGTEGDGYDSHGDPLHGNANYPSTVVDWILVSLRNDPEGTGGPVCQAAALLHNNGAIEFITGHFTCCNPGLNSEFWLVIEHRNHMIVMSEEVIGIVGGKITYDFRDKQTYVNDPFGYGIFARQKEVLTGTFAMFAGNGEQFIKTEADTDITFDDRRFWQGQNGIFGHYRIGDYNLNGDVNFNDRTLWEFNNGRFTSVVRD
ncbi:MAG: hypothetical protein IH598_13460, partial [Bacteroidales bacterium]|nr:hypothetical protein [Bacteroidales bacterium]